MLEKNNTKAKSYIKPKVEFDTSNPNRILDLSDFDYNNLTGENFKNYNALLDEVSPELGVTANTFKKFIFEEHRADPVIKEQYPGMPNSPKFLDGIKLKISPANNTSLVRTTKILIAHARTLNNQIMSEHSRQGNGHYWLLKLEK